MKMKDTQSTNDWENREIVFQELAAILKRSSSEEKQSQTAPSN